MLDEGILISPTERGRRNRACCFTGHRVISKSDYQKLADRLKKTTEDLIDEGVTEFYAGGALGFDTLAAQSVLLMKKDYPEISLHLILPCENQDEGWHTGERKMYRELRNLADEVTVLYDTYRTGCMQERNRALIDACGSCIAYLTKTRGGTLYTVNYAKLQGVEVINLAE